MHQRQRKARLGTVAAGVVLMAGVLGGCGRQLAARVVPGPAGIARVVAANDERMVPEAPGVAGASVEIRTERNALLDTGVSDEQGFVRFSLPSRLSGRIRIVTEADGYQRSNATLPIPPEGGRVLVIIRER